MKFSIYGPMDTGGGYRFCVKFSIKQPERPIGRKFLCGSGHDTMKSKPPRTYLVAGSRGGQMNHGGGIIRVCGRGRGERFGAGMKNPRAERTFAGALRPYARVLSRKPIGPWQLCATPADFIHRRLPYGGVGSNSEQFAGDARGFRQRLPPVGFGHGGVFVHALHENRLYARHTNERKNRLQVTATVLEFL